MLVISKSCESPAQTLTYEGPFSVQLSGRHHSTHQVLTGAGHAWCDVEVVPANEQEEEEGQHEQLPKPDCQHKYLRERERWF